MFFLKAKQRMWEMWIGHLIRGVVCSVHPCAITNGILMARKRNLPISSWNLLSTIPDLSGSHSPLQLYILLSAIQDSSLSNIKI